MFHVVAMYTNSRKRLWPVRLIYDGKEHLNKFYVLVFSVSRFDHLVSNSDDMRLFVPRRKIVLRCLIADL